MTYDEQLERWLAGESVHKMDTDECCPDYSCCIPELQWSEERRRAYMEAGDDVRETMQKGSMGALIPSAWLLRVGTRG